MVQWAGTGWDSNLVFLRCRIFQIILAEVNRGDFCHHFALGLVTYFLCKFRAAITSTLANHMGVAPVNMRTSVWTPWIRPNCDSNSHLHWYTKPRPAATMHAISRACRPLGLDMSELPTGPAPYSGPSSKVSDEDLRHTSGCPRPPIAGLQSFITMTDCTLRRPTIQWPTIPYDDRHLYWYIRSSIHDWLSLYADIQIIFGTVYSTMHELLLLLTGRTIETYTVNIRLC